MRYLLDTTLIGDHAHGYPPAMDLPQRLYEEAAELFTCDVVACEALSGDSDDHIGLSPACSTRSTMSRPIRT